MKKLIFALFVLIFIVSTFIFFKNIFVSKLLKTELEKRLGVEVHIGDLDVSFFGGRVRIEGLTIYNPQEFAKKEFVYIPEMFFICNVYKLLVKKDLEIYYLSINIERVNIIKNRNRKINFQQIHVLHAPETKGQFQWITQVFKFSLADVYYLDYYMGGTDPKIQRYSVDIKDAAFGKLDSFEDIVHLVTSKIVANNEINKILGITVAPLVEGLSNVVVVSGNTVKNVAKGIFGLPLNFFKHKN